MNIKFAALAGLVSAQMFGAAALAQDFPGLLSGGKLVIGTTGSAPPTSMIDTSGNLTGYDIAVMNRVAEELGLEVEWVQLDWAGLLPGLIAGRFDAVASGVTRTPERLANSDLIMLDPYNVNGAGITILSSNTEIKEWDDVCGRPMGGVRGAADMVLMLEIVGADCPSSVTEYPGWTEMILDLKNGRIEWIGMDVLGAGYLSTVDDKLKILPETRSPKTQSVALSSRTPELAEAINGVFAKWRADGTMDDMLEEWFGVRADWAAVGL